MKYDNPELLDRLAAEYVLGTLRGGARRRFAGLVQGGLAPRRAVRAWERRLIPLAAALAPVSPPESLWPRIAAELKIDAGRPETARVVASGPWRTVAAVLALISVALGTQLLTRQPRIVVQETVTETARRPDFIAVVANEERTPVWALSAYGALGELDARALNVAPVGPEKSYELWMLPDDGSTPVSLGLLPVEGAARIPLDVRRLAILAATSTLAVSLEPAGGSPTGAPTGPVLFTAPVLKGAG